MKYSELLIILFLVSAFSIILANGFKQHIKLTSECKKYKDKAEASLFISESFRKTCGGVGFDSLVEWQKKCKAMWNLDYIGWANAKEFMFVKDDLDGQLLYGTWHSDNLKGEVYCLSRLE